MRKSGILLHISSLPGPGGIGSLGKEAYAFADFLKQSGMSVWQVLPMGPTGYGESPYQSTSVYAGNPMLISMEKMAEDGLVTLNEGDVFVPSQDEKVEFDAMRQNKEALLRRAFEQSESTLKAEIDAFVKENNWAEVALMLHTSIEQCQNLFKEFCSVQKHDGKVWNDYQDFRRHWRIWASKRAFEKPKAQVKERPKGKTIKDLGWI